MTLTSLPVTHPPAPPAPVRAVLLAGLVVGILDAMFAVGLCFSLNPACRPARVFQSVAAGVLGGASYDMGAGSAAFGLLLHFVIALGWSTVYAALLARWSWLAEQTRGAGARVAAGVAVGVVVWLAMNLVIVPLSRATPTPLFTPAWFILLIGHPFVVGLPIVLLITPSAATVRTPVAGSP